MIQEFIVTKGPLNIFKYKWIAKAFTKDIIKDLPMKTDNWLDEIVYNPPQLNFVHTLREYQPYENEFDDEHFKFLGPSVYNKKEAVIDYVKSENPLVYISLGTVLKGDTSFFQKCIEAFRNEKLDVIISVGHKFDIRKLKDIPSHIYIYPSVPQLKVLEMADVFITHGGMNSVSESLVYGTPMIVIPFVSDQPVNARCVEKLGVGVKLNYSNVTQELLRSTVLSILSDSHIQYHLDRVQKLIQNPLGNKGGAEIVINYVLKKQYNDYDN